MFCRGPLGLPISPFENICVSGQDDMRGQAECGLRVFNLNVREDLLVAARVNFLETNLSYIF